MGRRKGHPGFVNTPGVSITSSQAATVVSVVGHCFRGFRDIDGSAAVETAGKKLRQPADEDPSVLAKDQTKIVQLRSYFYDVSTLDRDLILRECGVGGHIHPPEPEILL